MAESWKGFYQSEGGRVAIAELMVWCNAYTPLTTNDPIELARFQGERNVALRIAQLIGHKPELFPAQAEEDTSILDRILRYSND